MSRLSKGLIGSFGVLVLFILIKGIIYFNTPVDRKLLFMEMDNSLVIKDRYNTPMARLYPYYGGTFKAVSYDDLPRHLIDALVATEDKRFFRHNGVDLLSLARAFRDNLFSFKIVSGGSTLTQQLVRRIFHLKRSYWNKLYELVLALRLDHSFTKEEILISYLNHAFMGNQIYGIGAASFYYFGKEVNELSLSESAFLVGLLKSGTIYNPYKYKKRALERREYVLSRLLTEGYINKENMELALLEGVSLKPFQLPFKAPHFCFYIRDKIKKMKYEDVIEVRTTLDYPLQEKIKFVLKNNMSRLKGLRVNNASVVILNARTSEVLVMIGSLDFFNKDDDGQVNGTLALRQPGSSLKPFLYAYLFDKGHSPADVTGDIRTHLRSVSGDYSPVNYDRKFHGPVSIREALACSYNIPAVKWLSRYENKEYISLLRRAGLRSINKPAYFYGLGIALGTAEVRLLDLVGAYTVFPNEGFVLPINTIKNMRLSSGRVVEYRREDKRRVFSAESVSLINHILTDRNARSKAFPSLRGLIYPFDIAFKTGTSKDYRDAWVIGYTKDHIVGIWLGNFKGGSMNRVTGGGGAVPLLMDIFLELNPSFKDTHLFSVSGIITKNVCPLSGLLPNKYCPYAVEEVFVRGNEPSAECNVHKIYYKEADGKLVKKVFALLPSEYARWCRERNWEFPDKNWHPGKPVQSGSDLAVPDKPEEVKIIYPDDGDIFRMDPVMPEQYQTIELRARIPVKTKSIEWYFNNKLIKTVQKTEVCRWPLERGSFSIHVSASLENGTMIRSKPVTIIVQ